MEAELYELIDQVQKRDARHARQIRIVGEIIEAADLQTGYVLQGLYSDSDGDFMLAADILDELTNKMHSKALTETQLANAHYLFAINDVIDQATLGEMRDGTFVTTCPKAEVQFGIIDDPILPPELKTALIGIVGREMPGEGLDPDDFDAVAHALADRYGSVD